MLPYWYVLYRDLRLLNQSQHDPAARHRLLQARQRLLRRDLVDFLKPIDSNRPPLIHAAPESDSFMRWRAVMCGPPDTPWRWVTIEMRIEFPPDYPGSAPTITLLTPLFHPNVELETGKICADLLTATGWSAAYQLHGLLVNLQSMLLEPNTTSTRNAHAAQLYEDEQKLRQARQEQDPEYDGDSDVTGPFWSEVYRVHRHNMQRFLRGGDKEPVTASPSPSSFASTSSLPARRSLDARWR